MFKRLGFIFAFAFAIFVVGKISNLVMGVSPSSALAPVVTVAGSDADVLAAHEKARSTIDTFWTALDREDPNETNFALKVRFPIPETVAPGNNGEHVWLADVVKTGDDSYSGRLDNVPRSLPQFHIGQRITFSDDMISDWMFMRNGKIVGNESMRPLLARLPADKAAKLRTMLENP